MAVLALGWRLERLRGEASAGFGLFDSVSGDDVPPRFMDVTNEVLGVRVHEYGTTRIQRLGGQRAGRLQARRAGRGPATRQTARLRCLSGKTWLAMTPYRPVRG